jgi:ribosomal protein L11 methyltransferase
MSDGIYHELTVSAAPETEEGIGEFLFGAGAVGLVTEEPPDRRPGVIIRASFPGSAEPATIVAGLQRYLAELDLLGLPVEPSTVEVRQLPLEDWGRTWKEHFQPLPVGKRLLIAPPWEEGPFPPDRLLLWIDPAMAFGTGHHATTRMCLEALERFMGTWSGTAPPTVLDLGTGTGVLAIAAAALGAGSVLALDTDPEACDAARKNLARHAAASRVQVIPGGIDRLATACRFDLILANLDSQTLRPLGATLRAHLSPHGQLVTTGITVEDEALVTEAIQAAGLAVVAREAQDGWLCLVLRSTDPPLSPS